MTTAIEREHETYKSIKKYVIAKCPLCEKEHRVRLNWTGRGQPRVYCVGCAVIVAKGDFRNK